MSYQRSRILASACACVLGMAAMSAAAQQAPQQGPQAATELEEIVVTGSLIRGTPEDTALPVEVFSEEDLDNLGRPSNLDLLKSISEVGESFGEANRFNGAPVGAASINLRNLGSRFTTVIFNGRRFPEQYSVLTGRFNNINWIPNAAIGRVEILKEGGAATYGADAVGGVVNYITRRNLNGFEANIDYRYIEDSDGDYNADVLWGKTFDNGGNIMLVGGYQHRSTLLATDRDWAQRHYLEQRSTISAAGSPGAYTFMTSGQLGTTASTSAGAVNASALTPLAIRYAGDRQMSAGGTVRDPACTALGGFAGWNATPSPVCYMQGAKFEHLVTESDAYQLYAESNYDFSDSLKLHVEGLYYQLDAPTINNSPSDAPGSFPLLRDAAGNRTNARQTTSGFPAYWVSGQNPAVRDFLETQFLNSDGTPAFNLAARNAIINTGKTALITGIWRPFGLGGHPIEGENTYQHNNTKLYRLTTDLSGDIPQFLGTDLEWNVGVTYSRVTYTVQATDMLVDRVQDALNGLGGPNCAGNTPGANGCLWLNPFGSAIERSPYTGHVNPNYRPALANSAELVEWLTVPIHLRREYDNYVADLMLRGSTGLSFPWVDNPIAMAVGGQFRRTNETFELDDLSNRDLNPCPTYGYTGCVNETGVLFNGRAQGVLGTTRPSDRYYPVAAAFLEMQLPLMDSERFGSLNGQIAGRYEKFYSDVTDRDNSVVVPALALKWQPLDWLGVRTSWGETFSQVNPPEDDGFTETAVTNSAAFGGINYNTRNYDNLGVRPEQGSYFSAGFLFQTANFSATIDYFDVRVDDYARTVTAANVLTAAIDGNPQDQNSLLRCDSALFAPLADLGGNPWIQLADNAPCVQGVTTLAAMTNTGAGTSGTVNFFGGVGQVNAGELKTTGIDFSTRYRFSDVMGGSLTPSINLTYNLAYHLEDTVIFGVPVAEGYDGIGYTNDSTGRLGLTVPQYRGTFSLLYARSGHTLNIQVRYQPSVLSDEAADFTSVNASNANIGDAQGFTTRTGTGCTVPGNIPFGLVSNLGNIPAGAGTGEFAQTNGVTQTGAASTARGFCGGQNTAVISGQRISSSANVDLTYRVELPAASEMSINIFNLFDQDPAFARGIVPYNSGYGSPLGRTIRLALRKRF